MPGAPRYLRLDLTSFTEAFLNVLKVLSAAIAAAGIFYLAQIYFAGHGQVLQGLLITALGAWLWLFFGWLACQQDDSYFLHFPTRQLVYQRRGPWGARMHTVLKFEEIQAVGVSYFCQNDDRLFRHKYCLVLLGHDGTARRVSDWRNNGYEEILQRAQMVGQAGSWPVIDHGPYRALEPGQCELLRRAWVDRDWQFWIPKLVPLLCPLLNLACLLGLAWM
ncbi:hypothetical protein JST97_02890 [bacterium]|nr:hypothetical protein [bacterium]